jgi:hypothetical protein
VEPVVVEMQTQLQTEMLEKQTLVVAVVVGP